MATSRTLQDQLEKDLLTCPICCDTYTHPRVLVCQHTFCYRCLRGCLKAGRGSQNEIKCAVCRKITPLSSKGVAGIPVSLAISGLLQTVKNNKMKNDEHKQTNIKPETSTKAQQSKSRSNVASSKSKGTTTIPKQSGNIVKRYSDRNKNLRTSRKNTAVDSSEESSCDFSSDDSSLDRSWERICRNCNCGRKPLNARKKAVSSRKSGACCGGRSERFEKTRVGLESGCVRGDRGRKEKVGYCKGGRRQQCCGGYRLDDYSSSDATSFSDSFDSDSSKYSSDY